MTEVAAYGTSGGRCCGARPMTKLSGDRIARMEHWSLVISIGHFPMTPHEIKPKQLRALLLLLVLLPLIPTVLMVRFVLDLVQIEHSAALEKLRGIHQQTVLKAENAYARQLGGRVGTVTADDVHAYYRGVLDQDLAITVLDDMDKIVAGDARGGGGLLAQTSLHNLSLPWRLEISLANQAPLNAGVKERIHNYVWTVIVAIIAIVIIAAVAAITVGRQIALHELKTTSVA